VEKYCTAGQATDDNVEHAHLKAGYLILQKHTLSEYVIYTASPIQQLIHEGASVLRYMYMACLVLVLKGSIPIYLLQDRVLPERYK